MTTFETVVVNENFFKFNFRFAYVVLDEAHRIKNEQSLLAIALRHINPLNRLLLTGTRQTSNNTSARSHTRDRQPTTVTVERWSKADHTFLNCSFLFCFCFCVLSQLFKTTCTR